MTTEFARANIWKYYLATALTKFAFYTPIIQLFYLANNLTIFRIAILGAVWSIVKIIFEVPSSILADKWGRKRTMILSLIFGILQITTLLYANGFWAFLVASIWSAASFAFLSGTDIAFFYDNLKVLKRENEFDKLWARQEIYHQVPLIIAFISSGFLFKISPLLPFKLSLIFLTFSLIVALTLKEPKYHKALEETTMFSHFKQSIKYILQNNSLKSILLFTILFSIASDISYGYGQIYLKQLALPVVLFGVVYSLKSLLVTLAANISPTLRRKSSYRKIFAFQIIAITVLLYVMVLTKNYVVGAICFVLIAVPYGLFIISKSNYVHQLIQSKHRATIDSIFSLLVAVVIIIFEPVAGYLADLYTIKLPFLLIAIILSFYCIYYVFYGNKKIKK
ncbi:MAG: MFS transporter [Candidatus Heimdallarchaeaceae archaeon]